MIPWRLILLGQFYWSLLVVMTAGAVSVKMRMSSAWPWILIFMIFTVAGSALYWRKIRRIPLGAGTIGVVIAFLLFMLSPYLFKGYFLTSHPDMWAYCAGAEYLTCFTRGTAPGLVPLYVFAATLSNTRFGTFSVLAFLGQLFHSDAVYVVSWYTAILLFNLVWGIALLTRLYGASPLIALVAGSYAAICGLIPDAVNYGELDNLLFLSIAPFVVIRLHLLIRGDRSLNSILALAVSASAAVYAYPEGIAVAGIIFSPFFIFSFFKSLQWTRLWRSTLIFVGSFLSLTAPYLAILPGYLHHQLFLAAAGARVGQNSMRGLLSNAFLPSMFGLGDEYGIRPLQTSHLALALVCFGFLLAAILSLKGKRRLLILTSLLLIASCVLWQGVVLGYDYGLFKFLIIGSVLTTPLIFVGIEPALRLMGSKNLHIVARLLAVLVALCAFVERRERSCDYFSIARRQMRPYRELRRIDKIVGSAPVRLSFQYIGRPRWDDGMDQLWAAYFLRNTTLDISYPKQYLKRISEDPLYKAWQEAVDPSVRFVISNRPKENAIWSNGTFFLTTEQLGSQ
jgi:hypothetical protein